MSFVVRPVGGIGNQLFVISFAYNLKLRGFDVVVDLGERTRSMHLASDSYNSKIDRFVRDKFATYEKSASHLKKLEESRHFDSTNFLEKLDDISSDVFVEGYFQNLRYWLNFEETVGFVLGSCFEDFDIESHSQTAACHIRRGDYLTNRSANQIIGLMGPEYYLKSIEHFSLDHHQVKIFSDDVANICRQNWLSGFVMQEQGMRPLETLKQLGQFPKLILSNSTFAWWGASLAFKQLGAVQCTAPGVWMAQNHFGADLFSDLPEAFQVTRIYG